jgi:hypothetical protein
MLKRPKNKDYKYSLAVVNSRMDKFGNCYFYVALFTADASTSVRGTISANNIREDIANEIGWCVYYNEIPIREFDRRVKGLPCFGCTWHDIRANLEEAMAMELVKGDTK